jgi:predicted TIM-barrel fold metal-dependent hydrolase
MDVAALAAIDVHVHTELTRAGHDPMPGELREAAARYFRSDQPLPTVDDLAAYYRERNMAAVVFTVDWESRSGIAPIPNEEIADAAAANAEVLIPFASVDPARPDAVERARRLDGRNQTLRKPPADVGPVTPGMSAPTGDQRDPELAGACAL